MKKLPSRNLKAIIFGIFMLINLFLTGLYPYQNWISTNIPDKYPIQPDTLHFTLSEDIIGSSLTWNTFLGSASYDYGEDIAVDGDGNVYLVGESDATWGTSPIRGYTAKNDAYVAKLNGSGDLVWHTFLGGSEDDYGKSIALDASGNIYLGGYSDASWGTSPIVGHTGGNDVFAAKLNNNGALIWNTFMGSATGDLGGDIDVQGNGTVYLTGYSDADWGSAVRAYSADNDAFVAKLNSSGAYQWHTFLGGASSDKGSDIAVDDSGNSYISGNSEGDWGTSPKRAYQGGTDVFSAKLNTSGGLQWHTFLGSTVEDLGFGIAVDGSSNSYLTGYSDATWGSPVSPFDTLRDVFAAKLNSSGLLQWNTFLGSSTADYGFAIDVSESDDVFLAGTSTSTWGTPVNTYAGNWDIFTVKLNNSGDLQWNTFLGAVSQPDWAYGITADSYGNTYLAGFSYVDWGTPVSGFTGDSDALIAKLDRGAGDMVADFDGDGDTDISVFRPSTGYWYASGQPPVWWGASTDWPIPGDYDGDGTTDVAIWRPSNGYWYIKDPSAYTYSIEWWGFAGDIPFPGDYDGDGTTDITVFRPSNGTWYTLGGATTIWGVSTDIPLPCDYNGDGATDIAVFRPSTGYWLIEGMAPFWWGDSTDIPVPGDYDGDGDCDAAIWRPSNGYWYIKHDGAYTYDIEWWGMSTDIPVPADYDGDGDTDFAVVRPSTGFWYVLDPAITEWYYSPGDFVLPIRDSNGDGDPWH